jgi:hypothetical protein
MRLKIGYFPLSNDLQHPGDRRRLVYWARENKQELIVNPTSKVDVIVMSERANFGKIITKFPNTPKILDLVDGYLAQEKSSLDVLRGVSKVMLGQNRSLPKKFTSIIGDVCKHVQGVICSSSEQQATIEPHNSNVHIILDSHDEFRLQSYKDFAMNQRLPRGLLWEGMPYTLDGFTLISQDLQKFMKRNELSLTMLTDLEYYQYLNRFKRVKTKNLISKIFNGDLVGINLEKWSIERLQHESQIASLGVLPINTGNPIQNLKPENRLLIMWRLGLPVLTSDTPAYSRVAKLADVSIIPSLNTGWFELIEEMLKDPHYAQFTVQKGQEYLEKFHNFDIFNLAWNNAIRSVL